MKTIKIGAVETLLLLASVATVVSAYHLLQLGDVSLKEWILNAVGRDRLSYFVFFLTSAALILAVGAVYIKWRIGCLDFSTSGMEERASGFVAQIFRFRFMLAGGIGWGVLFSSFPFLFSVYEKIPDLQIWLSIFLFSLNLITGAVLVALIFLLRQSWELATLDTKITLYSRSTLFSTDYTALLRTVTLIAAVHILLALISVAFSTFPTQWLLIFALFSISILLIIYFVPQIPVKRRLESEKIDLVNRIGAQKKQILESDLTPEALKHLGELNALEEKVGSVSTSLSLRDDALVKWSAWLTGLLPYVASLLAVLGESSKDNAFVQALSQLLPVLRVFFGIPE